MKGVIRLLQLLQSSFQFAITSRISSQTGLPRPQSIGELFARKYFLKLFNPSREKNCGLIPFRLSFGSRIQNLAF